MPTEIPGNTTGTGFDIAGAGNYFLLDGSILTGNNDALDITGNVATTYVLIDGTILADGEGIDINNDGSGNGNARILIGADASIVAVGDGINNSANEVSIINYGTIVSYGGEGVTTTFGGDNVRFENHGSITGQIYGALLANGGGYNVNTGTIRGVTGVFLDDSFIRLVNSGVIEGVANSTGQLSYGIDLSSFSAGAVIINNGVISGSTASINADNSSFATVHNSGVLIGDVTFSNFSIQTDTYIGIGEGHVIGTVYGGLGNDILRGGDLADNLDGGADADELKGRAGDDSLVGGLDDDNIWGDDGDDTIDGGENNDTLRGGRGDDGVVGGDGDDVIYGGAGHDVLEGNGGNDVIRASDGDDEVIGGSGNDVLRGDKGEDILTGSSGSDDLFGGYGDDELYGGNGSDDLNGGRGDDTLEGGSGGDTFIFATQNGHDVVLDFEVGLDKLDMTSFDVATLGEVKAAGVNTEMGWLMDLSLVGGSGTILLVGVLEADLLGSDMIF